MDGLDEMPSYEDVMRFYKTHCIIHVCFPPKPDACMLCGASGQALYERPCSVIAPKDLTDDPL